MKVCPAEATVKRACVNTCQARALTFGDLDDPGSEVAQIIKAKKGFQLHPEYGTDPSVYYVEPGLANAPSNLAPLEATTGNHIQHLSTMDEDARKVMGKPFREARKVEVKG
jgi:hypothetical protein